MHMKQPDTAIGDCKVIEDYNKLLIGA